MYALALSAVTTVFILWKVSPVQYVQIQLEAAQAISLISSGPLIAGTPVTSLLHPRKTFFKKLILAEGVLPVFLSWLQTPVEELREQAIEAIGALSSYNSESRV